VGDRYSMDQSRLKAAMRSFEQLAVLSRLPVSEYPELRSALDRFRAASDRPAFAYADRIVDDVIAMEAISVASTELAYTMSARVSGLLADSDTERLRLFKLLKAFYRVRSIIVHGGRLNDAAMAIVVRERELRSVVRTML